MALVVADSSYIVEGLLKDSSLLDGYDDIICAPDFSLYEVLNAIWKHQVVLKQIKKGRRRDGNSNDDDKNSQTAATIIIQIFFDLISAGRIQFMALEEQTIRNAYDLAIRTRTPIYDIAFIVLAKELAVELKTFDKKQAEIFNNARHC